MYISKKSILMTLAFVGSAFATLEDECAAVNKLLNASKFKDKIGSLSSCCDFGAPYIKCTSESVTYLDLSESEIDCELPTEIGNLSKVATINLNNNKIKGSIPKEIGNCSNLKELDLSHNEIEGEIPNEISNIGNLKTLNLSNNLITGIPADITNLGYLTDLYLENNQISSEFPAKIENMKNLRIIKINNNKFTGSIPASIKSVVNLVELDVSNNDLSGNLPTNSIEKLEKLYKIDLSKNKDLSGKAPKFNEAISTDVYDDYVCNFADTSLCTLQKDLTENEEWVTKCKISDTVKYDCEKCVASATVNNNICECFSPLVGIGYKECSISNGAIPIKISYIATLISVLITVFYLL